MPENRDIPTPDTIGYGIATGQTAIGTKVIIVTVVVSQKPSNADDSGKIPSRAIESVDKIDAEIDKWDAIGEIDMLIADALTIGIKIPEPQQIKAYLSKFPDIVKILSPVCKLTRGKFSPENTQLSLEVVKDYVGSSDLLTLYIRQEQYDEDIMDKIDDICSAYGKNLIGKQGWLLVTTDFSPPK